MHTNIPTYRPLYRVLHRPLTLCGVDRRLFFLSMLLAVATFNLFYSFLAALLVGLGMYAFAWWSTHTDPQLLAILLRASAQRTRYDAAKRPEAPERARQR